MSNEVIELKAKMFDLIESNQMLGSQAQELSGALQAIATIVGVVPDETGNVQLTDIVEAVQTIKELTTEDGK